MLNRLAWRTPSFLVALAAIAVTFVLLRPACVLWSSHHSAASGAAAAYSIGMPGDHGSSVQCCASASDPGFGVLLNALAQALEQSPAGAVSYAVVVGRALLDSQAHRLRSPPPHPYSYYVRSARLLR